MATYNVSFTVSGKGLREAAIRKAYESLHINNGTFTGYHADKVNLIPSRADRLAEAEGKFEDAKSIVQELQEEMQNWYDNMPEGLQGSDKGSQVEEAANALQEIYDNLENCDFDSIEFPGMY